MTSHVVDASTFGPLFFDAEKDELFEGLIDLLIGERCIAPQHWRLDVTNQILSGLRRKRMTDTMADKAIAQIDQFPIDIDPETGSRSQQTYGLARKHALTAYDAAYLELALRRRLVLVTYDMQLRDAASAEGIALLPL